VDNGVNRGGRPVPRAAASSEWRVEEYC